jgi:hypothetical protein
VFIYYTLETETLASLAEWLSPLLPVQAAAKPSKERSVKTPKPKQENPYDKFQSEF